jgi:hypothetical protein
MRLNGVNLQEPRLLVKSILKYFPDPDKQDAQVAFIEELILSGVKVNSLASESFGFPTLGRYGPLHAAVIVDNWAIAEVLLEHGADPTLPAARGQTPVQLAVEKGSVNVLRGLAEWSQNPGRSDSN